MRILGKMGYFLLNFCVFFKKSSNFFIIFKKGSVQKTETYKPEQSNCQKVKKSSKIGQD